MTALTDAGAREAAESRARAELVPKLNALGKPLDWDSEVRKILIAAYKSRRSFEAFIIRELKKPPERDGLLDNFGPARQRYLQESINICARLEKLSEGQRIEALTSPDEVFEDPSDGWSLQDLDSRIDIYRYFLNPSQSETDAHQDQLRRLQNRYAELGWE